jgi:hypothetical protein
LSGELAEEIIRLMAGEKETTEQTFLKESNLNVIIEFLVYFLKEFREENTARYKLKS